MKQKIRVGFENGMQLVGEGLGVVAGTACIASTLPETTGAYLIA